MAPNFVNFIMIKLLLKQLDKSCDDEHDCLDMKFEAY